LAGLGAFNPAVAAGVNIGKLQVDNYKFNFSNLITALAFQFLAGTLAGVVFMVTESNEKKEDAPTPAMEEIVDDL